MFTENVGGENMRPQPGSNYYNVGFFIDICPPWGQLGYRVIAFINIRPRWGWLRDDCCYKH